MTPGVPSAEPDGITPRMGGEAWVEAVRALASRPWLTAGFVLLTAAMLWLEAVLGSDDGTTGMLVGDLLPSVVELLLAATLMIAVHRAVILEERRSPPPWQAPRMHLVFMLWLLAFGVLRDGLTELMRLAGTTGMGLLAHAGLFLAGVYLVARLSLMLPTIALTGSGGWSMLRGAWGLSRGHVLMIVLTGLVTAAPLLGAAVVVLVFASSLPSVLLAAPVLLIAQAVLTAIVLALFAATASLCFLACSRLQAVPMRLNPERSGTEPITLA